jgi:hypothetical protein
MRSRFWSDPKGGSLYRSSLSAPERSMPPPSRVIERSGAAVADPLKAESIRTYALWGEPPSSAFVI